jgi:hypothetical protein
VRICYENYIDTATIAESPAADASYPSSNVQDQRLATKWKATSTAAQSLAINLAQPDSVRVYALIDHNIASSATITMKYGNTAAVSAGTVTLTHNDGMIVLFASALSYYCYQLDISANDVPVEIGRVWIGDYITIDPSSLLDFRVIKKRSDNVAYNMNRQKYASEGSSWRRFELSFPPSNEAMTSLISAMYDFAQNHTSMIFCNFDTDRSYAIVEPCYVSIDGTVDFNHVERMKFGYSLALEEEL